MRAIVIQQYGGPEPLTIQQIPDPEPKPARGAIEVKASGINHAETHMRKGEWAEAAKVSGAVRAGAYVMTRSVDPPCTWLRETPTCNSVQHSLLGIPNR